MFLNIFAIFLIPVALSFPTNSIVDDKCADALEACKNIQAAQSCNAVKSCIKFWEILKPPEDNNEICDLCKEMVKEARDQLLSNETQDEIKQVFEGSCNLIPIKALAKECISVVDELIPTLIETLASRMDPNQVCSVAGLCNNGQLQSIMKAQLSETSTNLLASILKPAGLVEKCVECQSSMVFVKKIIKLVGLDAFTKPSFETCVKSFQGTTDECEAISKDVIPVVYHFLKSMDPNVFCGAMKSCPFKNLPKPVGDNLTCEFCETLVQYVRTVFTSESTKEEFKTAFTNMCKDLREFSSECSTLVNAYFDQFYDFITGQMDPKLVCSALGLCGDSSHTMKMVKLTPAMSSPQVDIFPAVQIMKQANRVGIRNMETAEPVQVESKPGIEIRLPESSRKTNREEFDTEVNEVNTGDNYQPQQLPPELYLHPSIIAKNDFACTVCKTVINMLEQQLRDKRTEDEIRNALDKVCSYLPKELDNQCQDFINEYTDMIVNLLIQEVNPDAICAMLRVCQDARPVKAIPMHVNPNNMMCEVCVKVMQYVEDELESNSTEEEIKEALDKACSYLPKPYSTNCQDFMDKYSEMIFELLSKEIAPRMVCSLIGICPFAERSNSIMPALALVHPPPLPYCEVCKGIMGYVEDEMVKNSTMEGIKAALEKACSMLPPIEYDKCRQFMDEKAEIIYELLAQEKKLPGMICALLGVCPAVKVEDRPNGEIECQICQYTLHYIQTRLMDNATAEEIKQALENACLELPQKLADECKNYVEQYGDAILALLAQEIDPSVICVQLNLCPASHRQTNRIEQTIAIRNLKIDTCGTCQVVVDYMDKLLENDDIDREIVKLVEKVCSIVPTSTREQCTTIIEAYGPYILQMIGQLADSKEVCQTIDLCARVPGHVHLLGAEKCTIGPSYWCQSSAHASACKAEMYCKQKVWGA